MQEMEFLEFGWDYEERTLFVIMRASPSILVDIEFKVEVHFFNIANRLLWTAYSRPTTVINYFDNIQSFMYNPEYRKAVYLTNSYCADNKPC